MNVFRKLSVIKLCIITTGVENGVNGKMSVTEATPFLPHTHTPSLFPPNRASA